MSLQNEKSQEKEITSSEIPVLRAIFRNGNISIEDETALSEFYNKSYIGTKLVTNALELEIEEALLLLERDRIKIFDSNQSEINAEQLLALQPSNKDRIWLKYLVYRDLRQRGYIVRRGYGEGIDFRLFSRGASPQGDVAKFFIYILYEANPIRLTKLNRITQQALSARKNLVLAVVDRLGEPTYYTLDQFNLPVNEKKQKFW